MVVEGIVRVKRDSKNNATYNLPTICGEFTQMVMVNKVLKHGIPCLSLEPKRIPWATTLDATCIGSNGEKSYILWICRKDLMY
jgi:hypothetical protein